MCEGNGRQHSKQCVVNDQRQPATGQASFFSVRNQPESTNQQQKIALLSTDFTELVEPSSVPRTKTQNAHSSVTTMIIHNIMPLS